MNAKLEFHLPKPDIASWRVGNTGVEGVWQFDSGEPGREVLITALIHGNELCGAWALKGLLEAGVLLIYWPWCWRRGARKKATGPLMPLP